MFLFLRLSKEDFMKFLFVPLKRTFNENLVKNIKRRFYGISVMTEPTDYKNEVTKKIKEHKFLRLISRMTSLKNRINLKTVQHELNNICISAIADKDKIEEITKLIDQSLDESSGILDYLQNLQKMYVQAFCDLLTLIAYSSP